MPRPKTVAAEYQPITVRLPVHIYDEICDVAEEEDRSRNEQVVRIVRQWYVEKTKQKTSIPLPLGETTCADVALTS
jgi:hypothetical protein